MFKSKEAFCVMQYACEECGNIERLWNSRDGVTPFVISSACCDKALSKHVAFSQDWATPAPPAYVKRVFVTMTRKLAVIAAIRQVQGYPERTKKMLAESYIGANTEYELARDHACYFFEHPCPAVVNVGA